MAVQTPEDYINYLITNNITISLIDFVKELNSQCENIDISFIDELLDLVGKNEICIPHKYLIDYGIITTENRSNVIIRVIDQYEAIENVDYNLHNVVQVRENRGTVIKKEYTLHPRLFKLCLMRSKNTLKYSKYYIFLEECIKYYTDYQLQMKQNENKTLHNKLDYVINKLDKSEEQNKQLLEQVNKILNINERLEEKVDILVDDRVIYPTDNTKVQTFVICKTGDKQYQMISGSDDHISNRVKSLKGDIILKLENVPNCYYLKILIKENMIDNYKFKNDTVIRNKSTTEKAMLLTVNEIYEERKNKDTV